VALDAPGWRDVDAEYSVALWSRGCGVAGTWSAAADAEQEGMEVVEGAVFRIVTADNNFLFDLRSDRLLLDLDQELRSVTWEPMSWHHRVWTVNASGAVTHYVDGQVFSVKSLREPLSLRRAGLSVYVGGLLYSSAPYDRSVRARLASSFRGQVDELMFFSRALSAAEVRTLHERPADPAQGLMAGVVLHYSFDAGGCGGSGASLLSPGCALTGDGVVRNLGAAGSAYDLTNGQLNDENGYGRLYGDQMGNPERWQFSRAGAAPSRVPWGAPLWPLRPDLPLVLEVQVGATLRVPLAERFGTASVADLALGSDLGAAWAAARGSNGSALAAGDSLAGEPFLTLSPTGLPVLDCASSCGGPSWFSLLHAPSAQLALEVHLWPPVAPVLSTRVRDAGGLLRVDGWQDTAATVDIGSAVSSSAGETFKLGLLVAPPRGRVLDVLGNVVEPGASALVGPVGLVFLYEPAPGFVGVDPLRVVLVSQVDGRQALELDVLVRVIALDALPDAGITRAAVPEDDVRGVELTLPGADALERHGLTFCIASLPSKGKLYAEDEAGPDPGPGSGQPPARSRRVVDRAFNRFDVGSPILQYASRVLAFSSYEDSCEWCLESHPLTVLGPPSCASIGPLANSMCDPTEGRKPGELPAPEEFLYYVPDGDQNGWWYAARVVAVHAADVDLDLLDTFRALDNGTVAQCLVDPVSFECSVELASADATRPGFLANATAGRRTSFGLLAVPAGLLVSAYGAWMPKTRALVAEPVAMISNNALFFGAQYRWGPHNQSATFRSDAMSSTPPFTEFIEVGFETAVFPVSVAIGTPRGGGAVVNVLARDASSMRWQSLYQGAPQREKMLQTNGKGLYFTFDEALCRAPFKTDALRIELDTSEESGISDWNLVDYVELAGAPELQPGVLRTGGNDSSWRQRLVYVPDRDQSGEDTFEFLSTDCLGKQQRESAVARATVSIAAEQDVPLASLASDEPALRCGVDRTVNVPVFVLELDGESVELQLLEAPTVGELALGRPAAAQRAAAPPALQAAGAGVATAAWFATNATFGVNCAALEPGITEARFSLAVVDTAGRGSKPLSVLVRVLKHDPSRISPLVRSLCSGMLAVSIASCVLAAAWTAYYRTSRMVKASQPHMLFAFLLGAAVSSFTIASMLVEDDDQVFGLDSSDGGRGARRASVACNAAVWTYCVGFTVMFAALYVKLQKVTRMLDLDFALGLHNGTKEQKEKSKYMVSERRMMKVIAALVLGDVLICSTLTALFPLSYVRVVVFEDAPTAYPLRTAGACRGDNFGIFALLIALYHVVMLVDVALICYRSRHINESLAEGKYISLVM
jgi:hypothetical protein